MQPPWTVEFAVGPEVHFAYIARGGATLEGGEQALSLSRGDFVMLAPDRRFVLGDPQPAELIAGKLSLDRVDVIPPVVRLPSGHHRALKATLNLLVTQVFQRGPQVARNRLADIVLLTALREQTGPLPVVDSGIQVSLRTMHESLDKRWTVADLASTAGMSRSLFAERFKSFTGESPLEYLTRHRMRAASQLIRESDRTLRDVAAAVGYHSDGAFHRAFRRIWGVSPGEYRRSA